MSASPTVAQRPAELVATTPAGAYRLLTFAVADVAEPARPGQFVALAVGGATSATLLRRSFSIHRATPAAAGHGRGTVELVVAARGPGTRWLTDAPAGTVVD
ncbi:MAG TPA: hypothetical protein VHM65_07795, partial [Candidatus Lustribacter sp.]|nr:hypothetical protein [Candidatus Lustribacter sp.]